MVFVEYLVKVDEKGRIVIPKEVREKLGIRGAMKMVIEGDKILLIPINVDKDKYKGIFKVDWGSKDVDEILKEAIEERKKKWLKDIST
ncbi:AbrB/MazE/SpoVT family DNA-binding domain-containing protein [Acidianus ambivalens]|uniref:AbrB/MazE/SpoVT family DNA-binding domain-containing protein n=1 Tax=Acidianus ambivalens TaxID=2283 RepID=A0A6G1T749_ACIAM|nr:AbrB/MazE/SpoVT family DNA-binding domain-containing protein [Acidianus ambivalens]